jgi:hypothetical protein
VEPLAESTEGLKAGWVDNNVSVGLLIFAVFVFVAFVGCSSVGSNARYSHGVRVSTGDVNKVV